MRRFLPLSALAALACVVLSGVPLEGALAADKPADKPAGQADYKPEDKPKAATGVIYTQEQSTYWGRPIFVKGTYGVGLNDIPRAAAYGFNVVHDYGLPGRSDEECLLYLNQAQKHRVTVMFGLGCQMLKPADVEKAMRRIQKFKNHPAIYGWYLADEPNIKDTKPADLAALYQRIKKADPHHPVLSSNWELGNFKDACDVDLPQLYHGAASRLHNSPLLKQEKDHKKHGVPWIGIANSYEGFCGDTLSLSPANLWEKKNGAFVGGKTEKEVKARVQSILNNLANPPFPAPKAFTDTPDKVRSQAFAMIAHGSNGIFYWLLQDEKVLNDRWGWYSIFLRPQLRTALRDTLRELDGLWPRICNPVVDSKTWYVPEKGELFCWFRSKGKQTTLIAINESAEPRESEITVPDLKGMKEVSARVNGENRRVKIVNGVFKDKFRADQVHVYLIDTE